MCHTRDGGGAPRPARALKRRAPRKKRRRKPAPAAVVSTRAYSPGRVVGSQSDSFTAPKVIFFRRLRTGALSTRRSPPMTVAWPARPTSLRLTTGATSIFCARAALGQCMQKSACFTSEPPRLELQKTACAQETARRTATDARSARLAEDGEFAAERRRAAGIDSRARAGLN